MDLGLPSGEAPKLRLILFEGDQKKPYRLEIQPKQHLLMLIPRISSLSCLNCLYERVGEAWSVRMPTVGCLPCGLFNTNLSSGSDASS